MSLLNASQIPCNYLHDCMKKERQRRLGCKGVTLLQCNKYFQRKKNNEKGYRNKHNFLKYQINRKMKKKTTIDRDKITKTICQM
jgi:hypothetical protein